MPVFLLLALTACQGEETYDVSAVAADTPRIYIRGGRWVGAEGDNDRGMHLVMDDAARVAENRGEAMKVILLSYGALRSERMGNPGRYQFVMDNYERFRMSYRGGTAFEWTEVQQLSDLPPPEAGFHAVVMVGGAYMSDSLIDRAGWQRLNALYQAGRPIYANSAAVHGLGAHISIPPKYLGPGSGILPGHVASHLDDPEKWAMNKPTVEGGLHMRTNCNLFQSLLEDPGSPWAVGVKVRNIVMMTPTEAQLVYKAAPEQQGSHPNAPEIADPNPAHAAYFYSRGPGPLANIVSPGSCENSPNLIAFTDVGQSIPLRR